MSNKKNNLRTRLLRIMPKRRLANYIKIIKANGWSIEASKIQFDKNGVIIDGHHRLKAIQSSPYLYLN